MMKYIRKHPPKGEEVVQYTYRRMSNDCLFVAKVKLAHEDIGISWDEETKTVSAWLISEFEAAQERERKRQEEDRRWEEENFKYFKEWLIRVKEIPMSDDRIWLIVKGILPYGSYGNELFREYLGSGYRNQNGYDMSITTGVKS